MYLYYFKRYLTLLFFGNTPAPSLPNNARRRRCANRALPRGPLPYGDIPATFGREAHGRERAEDRRSPTPRSTPALERLRHTVADNLRRHRREPRHGPAITNQTLQTSRSLLLATAVAAL